MLNVSMQWGFDDEFIIELGSACCVSLVHVLSIEGCDFVQKLDIVLK